MNAGFGKVPEVDNAVKRHVKTLIFRGNWIRAVHPSDIEGFQKLVLLDLRAQKHGFCVKNMLEYMEPFVILGLCNKVMET